MELILISGLSGSGKSVALDLLEDSGYYCVDNLPVVMLTVLIGMLKEEGIQKTAIAIDARSGHGIDLLPGKMQKKTSLHKARLFGIGFFTLLMRKKARRPASGAHRPVPESSVPPPP